MDTTIERMDIVDYANSSYLDYAMYVIGDRAIPHLADGFKPVHRRILYAMNELNLNAGAKYKKSARAVGDTLGKYHPHGDSACYEAMVQMAQRFNILHPLVDGQGNWGSPDDPKSFAAMRYTEAKMTAYADTFFEEIKQDTVTFKTNFDGTMVEPTLLPARIPNVLVNGTSGIAVGIATDVPSHNMEEVANACVAYLQKPKSDDDALLSYITVPDYPSGGVVISSLDEVHQAYRTGQGSITVRADIEIVDRGLHIKSLPPKVSVGKLLEKIDEIVQAEKLPVTDLKDRSDENTLISIFIEIKDKSKREAIRDRLLEKTDMECNQRVNMNLIGLDGSPSIYTLPNIIRQWCKFRQTTFERKKQYRLNQVNDRLHILEGLLTAYANLDDVIRIIREEDAPKDALMARYALSEIQAKAILDLRLRHLAKLEEQTLRDEQAALCEERDALVALLADDKKIKRELVKEIKAFTKVMAQPRRTQHIPQKKASESSAAKVLEKAYPVTVVLSKMGWVRALRGHNVDTSTLAFKTGDSLATCVECQSNEAAILMGDQGRFFCLDPSVLPGGKSHGEPVSKHCQFQNGEMPLTLLPYRKGKNVLLVSEQGNGFITPMDNLLTRARKGKHVMVCKAGVKPLLPVILDDEAQLLALTSHEGRLVIIALDEVNESNKSQGVRLMNLGNDSDNRITSVQPMSEARTFSLMVGKRKFSLPPEKWDRYRTARARRGLYFEGGRKQLSLLE